jgi:hypothetical protein
MWIEPLEVEVEMEDNTINFIGWILFVLSAASYLVASLPDYWTTLGSLFFLIACFVFLIPYFRPDSPQYILGSKKEKQQVAHHREPF